MPARAAGLPVVTDTTPNVVLTIEERQEDFPGVSGRLVSDATLFNNHFSYDPNAAPTTTVTDDAGLGDRHKGYAVPIGGVVAYENSISPSGARCRAS